MARGPRCSSSILRTAFLRLVSVLAAAGVFATLMPAGLSGQPPPVGDRRGPQVERERDRLEQRIRARFARMIKRELALSDEDAAVLSETTASFRARRSELAREERRTRIQVDSVLLSGDDAQASRLLVNLSELAMREAELLREEQERLLDIITPMQVLRYMLLREELGARVRGLARRPQGPGVDGRGPEGHT